MQYQSLNNKVVVITGASSGIGKLAAEEFLNHGARVVLAARSEEAMQDHLRSLGVNEDRAIVMKTDVSGFEQVRALADKAKEQFGRIDIWINNAAVSVYGEVDQLTMEEIRRVIDVNLMGQIHGMKVALDTFKEQHYGTIINVASVEGKAPFPLQSAYTASKHGVIGFSGALREELMTRAYKDIDISVIMPASMNTPLFTHAKSKTGLLPKGIPPIYDPKVTVDAIIRCAYDPQPEIIAGASGNTLVNLYHQFPRMVEKVLAKNAIKSQMTSQPKPMEGNDNLFSPMPGTQQIRGEVGSTGEHLKAYAKKHPIQVAASVLIPVALVLGLVQGRRMMLAPRY